MKTGNCSSLIEFLLLGFTNNHRMKVVLFTLLLFVNLIILLPNLGTISVIRVDMQLHTPMYLFPQPSLFDLCYLTVVGHKEKNGDYIH
jgi:olfactory receptor